MRLQVTQIRLWTFGPSPWDEGTPVIFGGSDSPYDAPNSGDNEDDQPSELEEIFFENWEICDGCDSPNVLQLIAGGSQLSEALEVKVCALGRPSHSLMGSMGLSPYPLADFRLENFDLLLYLRACLACEISIFPSDSQRDTN